MDIKVVQKSKGKKKDSLSVVSPSQFGSLTFSNSNFGDDNDFVENDKPLLFDVSWEVARKVGGIYTVLTSKAVVTVKEWKDRYAAVGTYHSASAATEFEPLDPSPFAEDVITRMREEYGIIVYFGRWLVKGYPRLFLLDTNSSKGKIGEWKSELMGGIIFDDNETHEAIIFGFQAALLLKTVRDLSPESRPIIAHFHEWLAGVGLILLKRWGVHIATIFTTHATLLGRYLAAGNVDLYSTIATVDPDQESGKRGIYHRHWIEAGATRGADVFTTVSDITGVESEYFLGRTADVITPNGLNISRFTALHEFQNLHQKYKLKIHDFIKGHFYGNYDFDLDKTLYFFIAGRKEYHNKGVDLFIEALAELNYRLKKNHSDITVVAFIIMPGDSQTYNVESIQGQSVRREIRETCNQIVEKISSKIFEDIMRGVVTDPLDLLDHEDIVDIKRRVQTIKSHDGLPPVVTHNMVDPNDEILCHIRRCNLVNNREDRVKIIYHPKFLSATSPILPLDYDQFVRGSHLGVFPSYYEPWGYTPAECTVMGVPSITSDLAGFGDFIRKNISDPDANGLYVIDRRYRTFDESKYQMADIMWRFAQLGRRQRIRLRNRVERLSNFLDWETLGKHYVRARNLALQKTYGIEGAMPYFFKDGEDDDFGY
jgi:glycogen(starch) synthase